MLKDYVKFRDIDVSRIEQYKGRLPEELFDFWREFGLGTFYNGYLKAIDSNEYIELVQQSYLTVKLLSRYLRQHLVISLHGKITSISGYSSIDIKIVI